MKNGILFVIPPSLPASDLESSGTIKYSSYILTSIPMGILSISAYLKKYLEPEIRIIDLNIALNQSRDGKSWLQIFEERISGLGSGFAPEVAGISALFNSNFSYLKMISASIREHFPQCLIVTGGGLPTNLFHEVMEEAPEIDAVCFGEGEVPFLKLLSASDKNVFLSESASWITREKLKTSFLPRVEYVSDLDEIPAFDYSLILIEEYQKNTRFHGVKTDDSVAVPFMTSRGCPFHCCFCASHSVHGRVTRFQSAARVLSDIDDAVRQLKADTILFEDDHFFLDKQRAAEILKGLRDRHLTLEFPNGIAVHSIDEEIVQALEDAGVRMATLAVESGSEYVLRSIIHKPLNLKQVEKAVELLRAHDIYIRAFFVIGFPGETEEHRKETLEFIRNTGFNWVAVMIATPIAGSELYRLCKEKKYLVTSDIENFHFGKGNILTEDFTPEQIERERYLINLDVNFINNYDYTHGHYDLAMNGFRDVTGRVPDHAFAYYCMARCYQKKGNLPAAIDHMQKFIEITEQDKKWKEYADYFNIPVTAIHRSERG